MQEIECQQCQKPDKRLEEQVEGSIFLWYGCPDGHEFEVDKLYAAQVERERESVRKRLGVSRIA